MRHFILAAALAATVAPAFLMAPPAIAQSREDRKDDRQDRREDRQDRREDRRDDRQDRREARHDDRRDYGHSRREIQHARRDARADWREHRRYDWNRPDPRYGNRYDAARYYRDDHSYGERRLSRNDRVYRGNDGRYYCRRSDGTTGLIIGALAGGMLGNALDNGRSSTLGTLIGAGSGALIGRSIDRGQARCR